MKNEIYLNYPKSNSSAIKVNYKITQQANIHTIECAIDSDSTIPNWLQLTKFYFNSIKNNNHFSLLFEDYKYNKNLDTILFWDKCYAMIMKDSKLSFDQ